MLKRILALSGALTLTATSALAQFKKAPGSEKDGGNPWSLENFDPGLEGEAQVYFELARDFLANYYGYLGIGFVVLCLFLFGRGAKAEKKKAAEKARRIRDGTYHDIEGIDDLLEDNAQTR